MKTDQNSNMQGTLDKRISMKKRRNAKRALLALNLVAVIFTTTVFSNPVSVLSEEVSTDAVQNIENNAGGDAQIAEQADVQQNTAEAAPAAEVPAAEAPAAENSAEAAKAEEPSGVNSPAENTMSAEMSAAEDGAVSTDDGASSASAVQSADASSTSNGSFEDAGAGNTDETKDGIIENDAEGLNEAEGTAANEEAEDAASQEQLTYADEHVKISASYTDGRAFTADSILTGTYLDSDEKNAVLSAVNAQISKGNSADTVSDTAENTESSGSAPVASTTATTVEYSVAGFHALMLAAKNQDGSNTTTEGDVTFSAEFKKGLNDAGYASREETTENNEAGGDGSLTTTTTRCETSWKIYTVTEKNLTDITDITDAHNTHYEMDENGTLKSASFRGALPQTVAFVQIVKKTVTETTTQKETEKATERETESETDTETQKAKETEKIAGTETEQTTEKVTEKTTERETDDVKEHVSSSAAMPAVTFDQKVTTDNGTVMVHVEAEEGAFEEGTSMTVTPVTSKIILDKAIDAAGGKGAAAAMDITFTKPDGTKTEPLKPIHVKMISAVLNRADEAHVVHVADSGTIDVVARKSDGKTIESTSSEAASSDAKNAVSFESDSFSVYAIVYTVDFAYSVNGKEYQFSLPGGEKIALSELVEVLGILDGTNFADTDAFLKEVKGVEFSDPALVKVTQMEGDWELESLEPFTTEESLTITMKNGDVITVKVTDDQESSNLGDFLTKVTVSGASVVDGHYVVEQGKTYNVTMNFKETANLQFDNEGNLTYNLPQGITLPEGTTKTIKIAVVSGGKTYEIPATVTANGTTVTVKFDETDPNYNKLAQATNVGFRVSVDAQFTENINKTQWGSKMDKDIILDTTDHSDAFAEKSGHFDESTGVFHYTVKVKANGDVTNVNVKDIISGNALIFNNDVQVTGNSSSYTNNGLSAGQKGFDYTFASMADGEEIIITYSASLDQTVAKNSDTITADQTKNTVTVQKEDGEPHNAVYSQEINMKSPQKSDGTIAGVTADGDKLYNWTIDYNPLALVSAVGDKIKDSIGASSQEYMKYYGNVTVKVYDHAGTLVDTRSFTPGSDSSWEYTIPTGDTTPYHYVFEYQTIVDETKVIEGGSSLELKNEVEGKGGKDSGKIDVGPTDETTIEKSAESFNQQEITWSAVVHVGEGGLNKAEVIDTLPNRQLQDYNWELGIDLFKEGSLTVEGLVAGENYTVDSTSDPKQVKIVFTKDGQPGLKGVPGGHDIKIKLTTKVDQRWLHEAELYGSYWQTHQNAISINGKSDTAEVEIGAAGVEKKVSKTTVTIDGEQKTAFEYNIVLKNVYDDSIVVTDTFDKDLLYLLEDPNHNKNSTNDINLHIYGGDQYNQNDPREGALINYSESENGVVFRLFGRTCG